MSTNIECQGKPIIFPILYGRRHCIRSWKAQASGDGRLVFCSLGFWNNYIWNRNRMAANWEGIPRPDFGGVRIAWHAVTYTTNYKPTGWIHNYEQSVVLYLLTCQNWHPWSSSIQSSQNLWNGSASQRNGVENKWRIDGSHIHPYLRNQNRTNLLLGTCLFSLEGRKETPFWTWNVTTATKKQSIVWFALRRRIQML